MAIDDWWAGRGDERYWMEITDRPGLGADLRAPQHNPKGAPIWHYALVQYTELGDIVFHWHKTSAGTPALVGWSEVVGPLSVDDIDWQARGTVGRARGHADNLPHWVMGLGGLTDFRHPVTLATLDTRIDQVMDAIGPQKYGPFYRYQPTKLHAQQAYLTKFPAALVPLVQSLAKSSIPAPPDNRRKGGAGKRAAGRSQGRLTDPVLRKAIENYAVDAAISHYEAAGATNIEILGKPYDLKLRLEGRERHIEVKGTTADGAVRVVLTIGEVNHAREWPRTDLFVMDGIQYRQTIAGGYELSAGAARVWKNWQPNDDALHPTEFSYDLPN
ncbi:protein NO VEIN domain-containing protein [Promicromonospora sukumoe]|uniref:protein NO VEIN domain-containing protein n=1 Tax=Promicromonospora sukumoe TaxID=88382 RepID=UPI00365F45A3